MHTNERKEKPYAWGILRLSRMNEEQNMPKQECSISEHLVGFFYWWSWELNMLMHEEIKNFEWHQE